VALLTGRFTAFPIGGCGIGITVAGQFPIFTGFPIPGSVRLMRAEGTGKTCVAKCRKKRGKCQGIFLLDNESENGYY
jgi:hypothetical protein